jgi:uncharacterized membrane protein
MSWFKPHDALDRTFQISIVLKGLDGLLEIIGGLLLLAVSPAQINRIVVNLTQHELSKDPHDYVATHLLHYTQGLTGASVNFAVFYLLSHGIVKVILVVALLRNKRWAYPGLIVVLVAFIVYQLYRIALEPTAPLVALTVFDAFVVWLTWREWTRVRAQARQRAAVRVGR